ncbi:uncharacterized protein LOC130763448 isoform X2 [Actinidia eriantha]|uniref:uncharacterized protein LOC130763448 isoform X2 n=1 Tax=Actinidia eriantha TaxID=165200 RepID=UPI002583F7BA|nr:uncharacterized protein LOC130763448 isoform X2 [Actinidia eriantha]
MINPLSLSLSLIERVEAITMHRSSSATRVSEPHFNQASSPSRSLRPESDAGDQLPTYDPQSHVAKKARTRLRSAETAVHLIPLLLVLCAIVLWFFSNPVDLVNKGDSIVARIEDLSVDGDIHGNGTRDSLFTEQRDFQSARQLADGDQKD